MRWFAHRPGGHEAVAVSPRLVVHRNQFSDATRARETFPPSVYRNQFLHPITRVRAREALNERSEEAMANPSPALNPNPPKLVSGAQIKAARALLGWRRIDLAAAAGLHRNAVAYWEGQRRMPRSEPFACQKMRAALLSAGVVTVSTPAPGVCLLSAGPRHTVEPAAGPVPMAPDQEGNGHRLITASNGPELCAMHNGLAVSAAQEQVDRSTAPDCEQDTETSGAAT
jgi:hypothetical protein